MGPGRERTGWWWWWCVQPWLEALVEKQQLALTSVRDTTVPLPYCFIHTGKEKTLTPLNTQGEVGGGWGGGELGRERKDRVRQRDTGTGGKI